MVTRATGTRVVFIVLLTVAAALSLFIAFQGGQVYVQSANFTDSETGRSIDCIAHAYSIRNIVHADDELAFDFTYARYSDAERLTSLSIISGGETMTVEGPFFRGRERTLRFRASVANDSFSVYPEDCVAYAVTCRIEEQLCR